MPFLFPHFKERLKFKRIVKAEAEENQVRTFYRYDSAGFGYENIRVTPINPCTLPNVASMFERFRRKALDNIDLNQMSHRYVSGILQND